MTEADDSSVMRKTHSAARNNANFMQLLLFEDHFFDARVMSWLMFHEL